MDQDCENELQTHFFTLDNESIQTNQSFSNNNDNMFCQTKQLIYSQVIQPFQQNLSIFLEANLISNQFISEEKLNANQCQINNSNFPEFDMYNNQRQIPSLSYEEFSKLIQLPENDIQNLTSTQKQQEKQFSHSQMPEDKQLQISNKLINHSNLDQVGLFMKVKSLLIKFGNLGNESFLTEKIEAYLASNELDLELDVYLNDQQKSELSATIRQHHQEEEKVLSQQQLNIISPQQVIKSLLTGSYLNQNEQKNKQSKYNPNSEKTIFHPSSLDFIEKQNPLQKENVSHSDNRKNANLPFQNRNEITNEGNISKGLTHQNSNFFIELENLLNRVKNQDHGLCYYKEDIVLMKQIVEDQNKLILNNLGIDRFEDFEFSQVWEDVVNKRNIEPFIGQQQNLVKKKQQNFVEAVKENKQLKIISQIAWIANGSVSLKEQGIEEIPHYKILIIGKTGAGKSTFINMIVNLIQKLRYEDKRLIAIKQLVTFQNKEEKNETIHLECNLKEFKDRQSDHLDSVSESQTQDCNMYTINTPFYKITFVDTPGLGDTKGTDSDKMHIQTIITKVQALSEINAILYIHKSSDCREDSYLKYYIDQLKEMLTKEYQKNFIVCFTNTVNACKIDSKQILQQIGIPLENNIYFENDCLTPLEMIKALVDEEYLANYHNQSKQFWDANQNQFEKMMKILSKLQPQKTSNLLDLLVKKEAIIQILFEKQRQIDQNENEKENLNQLKQQYEKVSNQLTQFRTDKPSILPYVVYKKQKMKINVIIKRILDEKVTFCHNCKSKCHDPCRLEGIYSKNDYNLKYCQAFKDSKLCRECNHSQDLHGHTFEIEEEVERIEIKPIPIIFSVEVAFKSNKHLFQELLSKQKEQINKKKEELENQIQEKEIQINKNFLFVWILNKEVQKVSFQIKQDITIEFFNEQIKKVNNDSKIDNQRKQQLIQRYKDGIEKYQQIKTRENYIQIGNFEYSIDQIEQEIKKILETCENRIMERIKNENQKENQKLIPHSDNSENLNQQGLMMPGFFCV